MKLNNGGWKTVAVFELLSYRSIENIKRVKFDHFQNNYTSFLLEETSILVASLRQQNKRHRLGSMMRLAAFTRSICSLASSSSTSVRHYASPAKPHLNVHTASGGPQAPADYCASLVRRLDPEAWLCSYFWPQKERAWWLAWRAFNVGIHPTICVIRNLLSQLLTDPNVDSWNSI